MNAADKMPVEIEITRAMVEAGAAIILSCYDMPGEINDGDREKVCEIMRAVADASGGCMRLHLSQEIGMAR